MASDRNPPRIRVALIVAICALAAGLIAAGVTYRSGSTKLVAAEEDKLRALLEVRTAALGEYLESVREEVRFWNKNRVMRRALLDFRNAWAALGEEQDRLLQQLYIHENPYPLGEKDNLEFAADGSTYSTVHARYHYWLRSFLLHRGVYDVFLFDPEGNLVYTSFKELDYATNLNTGPYKDTDLGRAFRIALENPYPSYVAFFDFAPYAPSHGEPASFFSSPVLDDAGGVIGVLAFQIPSPRIHEIMQVTAGMGESGETYVVGEDLLMRSDSRFSDESTTLKTTVDTVTTRKALAGETGLEITDDYRGIPVFSAYGPFEFEGTRWAVLAEVDVEEVMRVNGALRTTALYAGLGSGLAFGLIGALATRAGSA